jgi:signal transduction histidine kinase
MLLSRAANAADPTTFTGVALPASSLSPDDHVTRTFLSDFPRHATAKSISLMPIMRGGAIDAILKVVDSERSDYFGMRHLWLMQVAAGPLSSVILDLETQARALGDMRGDPRMLLENVEGLFFYREIATGIFHQLRNLLGDIGAKLVAAGTMLDMRAPDTNGARDEMDQSQKRVLEARTLIDSIERRGVSFSLRPRRCELVSDVVRPVLEKRRAPIEKAGIHLVQTLTDDKYRIEVDPAMMQEALTNLVNNSITALRKHASGRRELFVAVRQRRDEGKVVVVIRDTGIGMTAEDLGRVGTPLFTSDPERGSGLGVYFARKVVEKFRGELRYVYSQPEKGTEVHVSLPLVG